MIISFIYHCLILKFCPPVNAFVIFALRYLSFFWGVMLHLFPELTDSTRNLNLNLCTALSTIIFFCWTQESCVQHSSSLYVYSPHWRSLNVIAVAKSPWNLNRHCGQKVIFTEEAYQAWCDWYCQKLDLKISNKDVRKSQY